MQKSKYQYKDFEAHCRMVKRATTVNTSESPAVKHARIAREKASYKVFFENNFPHYAKVPCADFHIKLANAVRADKQFRGIFEAFRGAAKSVHTNIGIPLWLMIQDEMKCMLLISDNETKACRLLASIQAELRSNQKFINDYGAQVQHGNWEEGEFTTRGGVAFIAIGLGQSPRGTRNAENRPDLIVVDDADTKKRCKNPALVREAVEWITDDLIGSFDIGNERFVLCNNRISKNSILAKLHTQMVELKPKQQQWYYLRVNALDKHGQPTWPEKYTREYWLNKKQSTTLRSWEREYMNNPVEEGTVFSEKWIKWKAMLPYHKYDRIVAYIDPSFKDTIHSDYKAVKLWGRAGREFHLIDAFVRQCSIAQMVKYMYDLYQRIPQNVVVDYYMEANFLQDMIFDAFAEEGDIRGYQLPIRGDHRKKPDKYQRIEALSPLYERGFIYYNEAKRLDADFATAIEQLLAFEPGSKMADDSPDADEGAIYLLNKSYKISNTKPVIGYNEPGYDW